MRRSTRQHLPPTVSLCIIISLVTGVGAQSRLVVGKTSSVVERVSVSSTGDEGNGSSDYPSISADGRFIVFCSEASNLVLADTNGFADVFLRDRVLGTTQLVSRSSANGLGNGPSCFPSISADGRFIGFYSLASNLVPGDTNARWDVFRVAVSTLVTEVVSLTLDGTTGNDDSLGIGDPPRLSGDGQLVAFESRASDLTDGAGDLVKDVFIRDMTTQKTLRLSSTQSGASPNGDSVQPSISHDGTLVAFSSSASNLITGDGNGHPDIFIYDPALQHLQRVSQTEGEGEANGWSVDPVLSSDGTQIAFVSAATNLVSLDMNYCVGVTVSNCADVYMKNLVTGAVTIGSQSELGTPASGWNTSPALSNDGRFLAFSSGGFGLDAPDTNLAYDIFVRDMATGTLTRISYVSDEANGSSDHPSLSSGFESTAFTSLASNLVPDDENMVSDIFVREITAS